MRVVWTTFIKELKSYFFSPVSYIIAVLFYLWRGWEVLGQAAWFSYARMDSNLFPAAYFSLRSTFFMVLLVPPILTMRVFAEERRTGSLETLMTAPVRDWQIVLGKWGAALGFYLLLWLPTIGLLWVMTWRGFLGTEIAFAPVLTSYLGMFLLSSMLLAFGCFTSSLTDNVLLAAVVGIVFTFVLLQAPEYLGPTVAEYGNDFYALQVLYEKLMVLDHIGNWFGRGLVDTSQVVFYVGGTVFFLFLTALSLGSRRWR